MTEGPIQTLSGYLERVQDIRSDWTRSDHEELWFRGERQEYTTALQPELYRPTKNKPRKPISDLLAIERSLFHDFQRCAVPLTDDISIEYQDWDSYVLLQHHSGPTRLLDWSDGALIALHFAIRRDQDKDDRENAIVFILDPDRLKHELESLAETKAAETAWADFVDRRPTDDWSKNEWEQLWLPAEDAGDWQTPRPPLVLDTVNLTRRVAAQRSKFLLFGTDAEWLSSRRSSSWMSSISIDGNCKRKLRVQLRDAGVAESVIFPDLDGLGREMKQLWRERRDQGHEV
jgi:hypothetical protein